jgi:hypothetical protein
MTWVAAGMASGAATMAGVKYIKGRRDAKKDAKNRPQYAIDPYAKENLSSAKQQALQGMPEEQKQQYLSNLQRGSAYALDQSKDRKSGLMGVSAINQNQNDAYGNLASSDSQIRMQNQGNLSAQLGNMSDMATQEFQFNKVNPYYEGIAQRNANTNELFQNLNNSAQMGMGAMSNMPSKKTTSAPTSGGKSPVMAPVHESDHVNKYKNPYTTQNFNYSTGTGGSGYPRLGE